MGRGIVRREKKGVRGSGFVGYELLFQPMPCFVHRKIESRSNKSLSYMSTIRAKRICVKSNRYAVYSIQ